MPITESESSFTYDVSKHLKGVPEDDREDAAYDAGEAALQKIHEYMGNQRSPVTNQGRFEALKSKKYKSLKRDLVGNEKPNLLLNGDLIESMEVDANSDSFTISVTGDQNILKSHNHNLGVTVPKRQFLPNDKNKDESFKKPVIDAIKSAIAKYKKPEAKLETSTVPEEIAVDVYSQLFQSYKATKREQQIAKNVSLFKIEDIL